MQTPAFKRLAALPDDELRQLASKNEGDLLKKRYIHELAKDREAALHDQALQTKAQPAVQKQAQRQNQAPAGPQAGPK